MEIYHIIGIAIVIIIIGIIIHTKRLQKKIQEEGYETEGVVRIEKAQHHDDNDKYYVSYQTDEGEHYYAEILNPPIGLRERMTNPNAGLENGDKILIKYIPEIPLSVTYIRKIDE